MTPAPEQIASKLSEAQRRFFARGVVKIGNPEHVVPRLMPLALDRTWAALERRGLIMKGRFGKEYTPLGIAVRSILEKE